MAVLPIVEIPDPRLRQMCEPIATIDDEVRQLVADMTDTMYYAHGIGLAAIQVGVLRRVVVIDLQDRQSDEPVEEGEAPATVRDPKAYINPEILWVSDELSRYQEGCLSIPEQYAEVERPARCRVAWLDVDGNRHEDEQDGDRLHASSNLERSANLSGTSCCGKPPQAAFLRAFASFFSSMSRFRRVM